MNYNKLGYKFYKSFLFLRNLSKEDENRLTQYVKSHPNIINLVKQISPWDIELEIMVKSHQEYNKIIDDVKEEFSEIIVDVESAIMSEDYVFPAEKMIFE